MTRRITIFNYQEKQCRQTAAGAPARWRRQSAGSRFGRPQDALCAMEGVRLKSGAIIASIGEICRLVGLIASLIFSTVPCRADSAPAHAVASAHPLATAAGG